MNNTKKATVLTFILLCFILFASCSYGTSNNVIPSQKLSNDGTYKAVKFRRDLGATTTISYQLSVLKSKNHLKNEIGNVYISYDDFEYEWIDESVLKITVKGKNPSFKAENCVENIKIVYQ